MREGEAHNLEVGADTPEPGLRSQGASQPVAGTSVKQWHGRVGRVARVAGVRVALGVAGVGRAAGGSDWPWKAERQKNETGIILSALHFSEYAPPK